MTEASSLTPRFPVFLHGGDYNPDQWLDHPEILEQDIELMHKAHVNCVSIAIFAWARLEPEDGVYDFAWLDEVIDRLWRGGIHIILATPSGARPAWMAQKYPEVLRVNQHYERYHFGGRHNHCLTSPVYRRKVGRWTRRWRSGMRIIRQSSSGTCPTSFPATATARCVRKNSASG